MFRLNRYLLIFFFTFSSVSSVLAFNNKNAISAFGPPIPSTVLIKQPNQPSYLLNRNAAVPTTKSVKKIVLMNYRFTSAQKKNLFSDNLSVITSSTDNVMSDTHLPAKVDLGMNNTAVLDQGEHGSCVTFANSAAIDAILNKGEYVSPLCLLQLGTYLSRKGFGDSGWDGANAQQVLGRINEFGIMTMSAQRAKSCGGLTEYPLPGTSTGTEISLDDYHANSINLSNSVFWYSLLTGYQRFATSEDGSYKALSLHVLTETKKALASSTTTNPLRITFGVAYPFEYCNNGACGTYRTDLDTWVLNKRIISALKNSPDSLLLGGHEMIITGYDDNAVVVDDEGTKHTGIFMIRNSWGPKAGDNGNFYMTYDFFRLFAMEVTVIQKQEIE